MKAQGNFYFYFLNINKIVIKNIPILINSAVKIISDLMGLKLGGLGNIVKSSYS